MLQNADLYYLSCRMGGIFAASRTRETLRKRFHCTKVNLTFPFKQRSSFISENDHNFPAVAYSVLLISFDCRIAGYQSEVIGV